MNAAAFTTRIHRPWQAFARNVRMYCTGTKIVRIVLPKAGVYIAIGMVVQQHIYKV